MIAFRQIGLGLAAPLLAFLIAAAMATGLMAATGDDVAGFWDTMLTVPETRQFTTILNETGILYLAGVAAAIGFRMNLFNIGVEGQYRVGAFAAAWVAGEAWLPGAANMVFAVLVAMTVGALWAGLAALLRVTRGVSEVISTIMLNAIAGLLVGYIFNKTAVETGLGKSTQQIPESSWLGGIQLFGDSPVKLHTLVLLAVVVGVGFGLLLSQTRFGFDLRATGQSETAAVAAGVNVKRMVIYSMLLSGAVAGLIGMPVLFGQAHSYGSTFETGIGFAGIAVALLGRNHPIGIAFAALIFAYLNSKANALNILAGISPHIIAVTQGIIVLAVVIAYELVRRYRAVLEQATVAAQVAEPAIEGVAS
jgi:general nucleoside transport system permease protein